MTTPNVKWLMGFLLLALSAGPAFAQGVTTAGMRGVVKDANGATLPGANVVATHVESGSVYGASTGINGSYTMRNMRVGGPYAVEVTFVGFEPFSYGGIYLTLGETYRLDAVLAESALELAGVEVVAARGVFDAERTGVGRNIDEATINSLPTIGRDLADFARMTPAAFVGNDDDDGPSISIAGQNNRYNSIYIDGAVNNDVFGLSAQGTNGGQTGSTPIAIDAIEEFQINLSPYDVSQSGFTGGAINAVTRSGTNRFEGSAYYYTRNENFVGKTPPALLGSGSERTRVADFSNQRFGARLGGPIIKNKLFFFANVEILRSETPQPFDVDYTGNSSLADLDNLRQALLDSGYDPGEYGSKKSSLDDDKVLAKLDWNANPNNKVSLRYSYSKSDNVDAFQSDASDIEFSNNSEVFPNKTHSLAAELNSTIGNNYANKLIVGFTRVSDDRGFAGDPFPEVNIDDGSGEIHFGSEPFSTGNILEQDILTVTNNFNWFRGDHTLTFGTHFEYYDIYNLFIAQNFGVYDYDSVDDFLSSLRGTPVEPGFFTRGYSLVDDETGDASNAAGVFKAMQLGFYVQDEFQLNEQLRLTGGIRVDIPKILDEPIFAPDVMTTTIPDLSAKADLKGALPGQVPKAAIYLSPRVGFNYDVLGDRTVQLRGGLGVFTGRVPFVWPGGMFTNNGATVGRISGTTLPNGDPVPFVADPSQGLTSSEVDPTQEDIPSGRLEMFEEDYKYPRVFRTSLGVDYDFGSGLVGTLEGQYTKNLSNIVVRNLNLNPDAVQNMDGPDGRPFYTDEAGEDVFIDPRYEAIHVVGNTSEGYSYDVTASLTGAYDDVITEGDRVSFNLSYTYGTSKVINDGTSSQINSNWRTVEIGNELPNNPKLSRSDFAIGSRILAGVTFRKAFLENLATTVSLLYTGESGALYNYTIDRSPIGGGFRDYALIYVPNSASELTFIQNGDMSPADQAAAFDRYIDSSEYLSSRRGTYVERNGSRMPFENIVDLRLAQEVWGNIGGRRQTLEITLDIFNLTNLLNKDWGQRYNGFTSSSNGGAEILEFNGFVDEAGGDFTPQYQLEFDPDRTPTEADFFDSRTKDSGTYGSRWQMQLGVRYKF
ncbi:MAG: TonB-dependent receptor [Rhodothermales bacterium]|nr:TonB-dependent receptor [Rhodothermales bacterium]